MQAGAAAPFAHPPPRDPSSRRRRGPRARAMFLSLYRGVFYALGFVYPAYESFKALEKNQEASEAGADAVAQWLTYWVIFSLFAALEAVLDRALAWFPLTWALKLAFVLWLQLPQSQGARVLYRNHVKPLLQAHEERIDRNLASGLQQAIALKQTSFQWGNQMLSRSGMRPPQQRVPGTPPR